ncbi:superoxide dismutase family protein [Uruburuella testudinis]|uniref:Superoxide dismutase family protein n=1 Tax=Uruburuella testudinis TaxID=1282863 RepID=A0ABY4DYR2_9NEIS|nr:superoxide dismutase family protein [Uruburuella testudinis]UOO81816.1 superoxide dismutase family protein [Uruburuella testudinis]
MKTLLISLLCCAAAGAYAAPVDDIIVPMSHLDVLKGNRPAGEVRISQSPDGAVFAAKLNGVAPGSYGFHVHEFPSCEPALNNKGVLAAGQAAGGHWDPLKTGAHKGPFDEGGHLGDLPVLTVAADGSSEAVTAPRIKNIHHLHGHALMIHEGGDNYSDKPAALGGGGARMICGVIR